MKTSQVQAPENTPEVFQFPWLKAMLDELDYGILVWTDAGLVHCNRSAVQQLAEANCPLERDEGRLVACHPTDNAQLHAALEDALVNGRRRLVTVYRDRRPLPLAIVPLSAELPAESPRAVMIVMARAALCPQLTTYWYCLSHQLTPTESNVVAGLFAGDRPSDIARRHGVAMSTVRSQIASVNDKTNTRSIRDLLRQAAALPPLVPLVGSVGM